MISILCTSKKFIIQNYRLNTKFEKCDVIGYPLSIKDMLKKRFCIYLLVIHTGTCLWLFEIGVFFLIQRQQVFGKQSSLVILNRMHCL